jgi:hypothetical protein
MDINALNIEMLRSLKIDWHFLTPIQTADVETLCRNGYLERAIRLLQEKTAGIDVFGFKDPRVAKLLPFWKRAFAHGNIQADYILVIRHPRSVCDSLEKRNHLDHEKSYLLWLEHVVGSLVGTEGEKRVLVDYDLFMQAPENELTRISGELRLPINTTELQIFRQEFLDHDLQHTVYELDDLRRDNAPIPVQEVYSSLWNVMIGSSSLEDPAFANQTILWKNELSRLTSTRMYIDKLTLRLSATNAARKALQAEQELRLQEKARLLQALQELRAELSAVQQSWLWRRIQSLKTLLSLFTGRNER